MPRPDPTRPMGKSIYRAIPAPVEEVLTRCTECLACVKQCAFLTTHGTPKALAQGHNDPMWRILAFQCNLCGLCAAVCPEKLDPSNMFFTLRCSVEEHGELDLIPYKGILGYEKIGRSALLRLDALPKNCDTVLFPGCAFPGTRPKVTRRLYKTLAQHIPNLGVVLDCCSKPSHDLGRLAFFRTQFTELKHRLISRGVRTVLVTCPNCYKVFTNHAPELKTRTVYEILHETNALEERQSPEDTQESVIHDPCVLRDEQHIQDAVRGLAASMGLREGKMRNRRKTTLCCGEGASVNFCRPEFSKEWADKRVEQAAGRRALTYCAGCAQFLSRKMDAGHVLDEALCPEGVKPVKSPRTYVARLLLKLYFWRKLRK